MQHLNLSNHIRAYKLNGESQGILKNAINPEIETILNDAKTLSFALPKDESLQSDQNLIYKNHRYIVTEIKEARQSGMVVSSVTAMSAFIELNNRTIPSLEFLNSSTRDGLQKILNGTGWTIGSIETVNNQQQVHAMKEEKKTVLYLVRVFANVTGYEVDFDTINRKVNFVKSIGRETDFVFRYRKNIKEIIKTEYAPTATVMYPQGKGGLTISSVNNGRDYIEDYSWYTSQGMTLSEARQKYRKEYVWEDERYIYAGNLMRAAQKELKILSRPQISYETKVITIGGSELQEGDYAYVIDEELGVRLPVRVMRIKQKAKEEWNNEIEFNYLIPGLSSSQRNNESSSNKGEQVILAKNQSAFTANTTYQNLLQISLTSYASTNLQAGFYLVGQSSTSTVLRAYFTFKGERIGPEFKQSVNGWCTLGIPFIMAQIPEGSGFLNLYVKVDSGTLAIALNEIELFVKGENLFGGMSSTLPSANIVEEVEFDVNGIVDNKLVQMQVPIRRNLEENVAMQKINVNENISIEFRI